MKKLLLAGIAALTIAVQAATTTCVRPTDYVFFYAADFNVLVNNSSIPRTGWYKKTDTSKESGYTEPLPNKEPVKNKALITELDNAALAREQRKNAKMAIRQKIKQAKENAHAQKNAAAAACRAKQKVKQQEDARRAAMYPQTPPPTPTRKK